MFEDTERIARDIAFTMLTARDIEGYGKFCPVVTRFFFMDGDVMPDPESVTQKFHHHYWRDGGEKERMNERTLAPLIQAAPLVNGADRKRNVIMVTDYGKQNNPPWAFVVGSIKKVEANDEG
jgi:hypothetical protein